MRRFAGVGGSAFIKDDKIEASSLRTESCLLSADIITILVSSSSLFDDMCLMDGFLISYSLLYSLSKKRSRIYDFLVNDAISLFVCIALPLVVGVNLNPRLNNDKCDLCSFN